MHKGVTYKLGPWISSVSLYFTIIHSVSFIMAILITSVSVAQVATTITVSITIIQWSLPLLLIALLVHFMPKINTALAWSSISKTLHSSLWPIILRADTSSTGSGARMLIISFLTTAAALLVIIAGTVAPLGLSTGPLLLSKYGQFPARYIPDNSALALATTPRRESFVYGRQCGIRGSLACPGNDSPTNAAISPSLIKNFNSTPHGPFAMQYRQFFNDERDRGLSEVILGTAETLLLRNDAFVTEGLVVDMSEEHPGLGFLNQTMPIMEGGGTWSQDILWLEPVTACVNTNLTIDYALADGLIDELTLAIRKFTITDNGGFSNLITDMTPSITGQQVDLYHHAYLGAVSSNLNTMQALNITSPAPPGKAYQISNRGAGFLLSLTVGRITTNKLRYVHNPWDDAEPEKPCRSFGVGDPVNINSTHISCGIMLGPPIRIDGGDSRVFNSGSKWSQELHSCASITRASIQTVTFSASRPLDLQSLRISRNLTGHTVIWAMEETDLKIDEFDSLWGRVDERLENSPSLSTLRSDHLHLPATRASVTGDVAGGSPQSFHAAVWEEWVYFAVSRSTTSGLADYTGQTDYAMKNKFQLLVQKGRSDIGASKILNLIWTDIMANNLIGTQTDTTLLAAQHLRSIDYDFRFAVFGMTLLAIWIPSFLGALFLLVSRMTSFRTLKGALNHLSVGRVVVGSSTLHLYKGLGSVTNIEPLEPATNGSFNTMVDPDTGSNMGRQKSRKNVVGKSHTLLELGRYYAASHT